MRFLLTMFLFTAGALQAGPPPFTDYGAMLERDIAGKQHGFLAGNHLYYVGGAMNTEWEVREHETLGFTHPMFRDGRARGFGIAEGPGGPGHDKFGWEFWNQVRGAYGTVIADGKTVQHPKPLNMLWRPDRTTCRYEVNGAKIEEIKFISRSDVLCSIITADRDITLSFEGQSFVHPGAFPTFDGDAAGQVFSQERSATGRFDEKQNAIHITEGGTILVKPAWKQPAVTGRMMYDGMSVVISANQPLLESVRIERDAEGRQVYRFTLACGPGKPAVLSYAMGDDYAETAQRSRALLADPQQALAEKTAWFNGLLNEQIPYFRCSDAQVVKTYYYLWSLYFMYHTYTGKGYESYPHTQTAINNFMGLHLWDSWAYAAMGTWMVDKAEYAYGNILSWKHMLPFKDRDNALPDNFGTTWHSPGVWMNLVGQVERAWLMYEQSGDLDFLRSAYEELYKPLYWEHQGPQQSYGSEINALDALIRMARTLGHEQDIPHWETFRPAMLKRFEHYWGDYAPDYFGIKQDPWKDIWNLSCMQYEGMPKDWVNALCERWVMNSEDGFLAPVSLQIRPPTDPPNGVFAVSTISTWLAVDGMFRHGRDADAVFLTLNHIRAMNKDYGFPVAPECWDPEGKPWGSMYYNWDGPVVDLLLRHIAGIRYSLPQARYQFRPALPPSWDFLEVRLPIRGKTWTTFRADRTGLRVEHPPPGMTRIPARPRTALTPTRTYAAVRPVKRLFDQPFPVTVTNIDPHTRLRYTLDGSEPTRKSPRCDAPLTISKSCELRIRAFDDQGRDYATMVVPFKRAEFHPGLALGERQPGLELAVYEGDWKQLPDLEALNPVRSGTLDKIDADALHTRNDHFAARLSGFIKVPEDGLYTFQLWTDDGTRLTIAEQPVVELDILCEFDAWRGEGVIGLKAGLHPFQLDYFQAINRRKLELSWRRENGAFQRVGPEMLFRKAAP